MSLLSSYKTQIKYKLLGAFVGAALLMVVILGGFSIYSQVTNSQVFLEEYSSVLYEEYDHSIKSQVETAVSLIQFVYNDQQSGLITEEEAKKIAADQVRSLRFDNENYFWVDTTEGINVVLLGNATEGTNRYNATDPNGFAFVKDGFIKNGTQEGGGFTDYQFAKPNETQPTPKRGYTLEFEPYGWVVGTGNWIDDIEENMILKAEENSENFKKQLLISISAIIVALVVVIAWGVMVSRRISEPLKAITQEARKVAEGDLTVETSQMRTQDELGQLSEAFETMTKSLVKLVSQVSTSSAQVAASSQQLTTGAEQSAQASNEVAAAIMEVAQGTEQQMKAVNQVTQVVEDNVQAMERVKSNTNTTVSFVEESVEDALSGHKSIERTIDQMNNIQEAVQSAADVVNRLGVRSKEIGLIVEAISGIANQTNLLALNAAIEAARAGEQGRGFSVVAEEVKKLAEQSQEAAQKIATLISEIQTDTNDCVASMQEGTYQVEEGSKVVKEAGLSFDKIARGVQEVTTQIQEVAQEIETIALGNERIVQSIQEVQEISQSIADQTQTVSASTEEQSASIEEIAASSQMLTEMAANQEQSLRGFKIAIDN